MLLARMDISVAFAEIVLQELKISPVRGWHGNLNDLRIESSSSSSRHPSAEWADLHKNPLQVSVQHKRGNPWHSMTRLHSWTGLTDSPLGP
jgi:hypothetical protein